ncbi:MAG TPA: avidin/streptavidin family protein, partial [Thermoanaerobaculia bacterium]|nr:avidin/streptavidin family protein [Thermoanaerobaculia bacterium]
MNRTWSAILSVVVLLVLACGGVCAAQGLGESAWTNQSASTLYIEDVDSEGLITGFYINRAAGFSCIGTPYPVTGWVLDG